MRRRGSKGKPPHPKRCAYCGQFAATSRDHLPPDSFFPDPKPMNMVTVPACSTCHLPTGRDDEYFRLVVALNDAVKDSKPIKPLHEAIFRSLRRPDHRGLAKSVLRNMRMVDVLTPSGVWVGRRPAYDVDREAVARFIERLTRGLFYLERGRPFPSSYRIRHWTTEEIEEYGHEAVEVWKQKIIAPLLGCPMKTRRPDVFWYKVGFTAEDPSASAWLFAFFEGVFFVAMTANASDLERMNVKG